MLREVIDLLLLETRVTETNKVMYINYLGTAFSIRTKHHWKEGYLRYIDFIKPRDIARLNRVTDRNLLSKI